MAWNEGLQVVFLNKFRIQSEYKSEEVKLLNPSHIYLPFNLLWK